jgi:hypothetical protein
LAANRRVLLDDDLHKPLVKSNAALVIPEEHLPTTSVNK